VTPHPVYVIGVYFLMLNVLYMYRALFPLHGRRVRTTIRLDLFYRLVSRVLVSPQPNTSMFLLRPLQPFLVPITIASGQVSQW
jgi:hypothetical protein